MVLSSLNSPSLKLLSVYCYLSHLPLLLPLPVPLPLPLPFRLPHPLPLRLPASGSPSPSPSASTSASGSPSPPPSLPSCLSPPSASASVSLLLLFPTGDDYTDISGVIQFSDGAGVDFVDISLTVDNTAEDIEIFQIVLSTTSTGVNLGSATADIIITDTSAVLGNGELNRTAVVMMSTVPLVTVEGESGAEL